MYTHEEVSYFINEQFGSLARNLLNHIKVYQNKKIGYTTPIVIKTYVKPHLMNIYILMNSLVITLEICQIHVENVKRRKTVYRTHIVTKLLGKPPSGNFHILLINNLEVKLEIAKIYVKIYQNKERGLCRTPLL